MCRVMVFLWVVRCFVVVNVLMVDVRVEKFVFDSF